MCLTLCFSKSRSPVSKDLGRFCLRGNCYQPRHKSVCPENYLPETVPFITPFCYVCWVGVRHSEIRLWHWSKHEFEHRASLNSTLIIVAACGRHIEAESGLQTIYLHESARQNCRWAASTCIYTKRWALRCSGVPYLILVRP